MQYCEKCNVKITGNHTKCPLCQGDLRGEITKTNTFPNIPKENHIINLILKISALVDITTISIAVLLNLSFGGHWSLYVVFGSLTAWIVVIITIKMHGNLAKNTIWLTAIISILSVVWDILTGYRGWSIDYVLPILCCSAMIEMAIVAYIKRLRIEDFIFYMIIDILFGIIPLVLMLLDVVTIPYPSIVCVVTSIISLSTLILFEGKALKAEIVRRMHI